MTNPIPPHDRAYRRMMERGTLRCGYTPWPVLVDVDPLTKSISGVFVDYAAELARILDIKVELSEEMPFGEMPKALNEGRIDAHCSGAWTNPIRGKLADNVIPISYEHINAFVRAHDTRFDHALELINDPKVTVSLIDGESSEAIVLASFPKAVARRLPQHSAGGEMLEELLAGKVDVAFTDPLTFHRFSEKTPNAIRQVPSRFPVQVYGSPIWVRKGEVELRNTLNVATMQLINDGTIEKLLTKHEPVRGIFLRPNPSFLAAVGL